jgi:glycosyltransferase involved in cell wall biosynthesis
MIPTLAHGGMERIASELTCNLPPSMQLTIVLFENNVVYPYQGELHVLNAAGTQRFFMKGINFFRRILRFHKLVKHLKPDAVLSFSEAPTYVMMFVKLFFFGHHFLSITSVRTATSKMEYIAKGSYSIIHKTLIRWLYRMTDCIITNSYGVAEDLIIHFGIKRKSIKVIHNPIDLRKVKNLAQEGVAHPWFQESLPIIINVGRLERQKNQKDLLKAFAEARKEIPCRLVIVGDGSLKADLIDLAKKLNIVEDVLFLGFQDNPFKYVARSSLFVFPSLYEGFGNVILEAMAVGCPVISYDCVAGPREIIAPAADAVQYAYTQDEGKYGVLIPVGDISDLSKTIVKLLGNSQLSKKYSELGLKRALEFEIDGAVQKYLDVILGH